MSDEPFDPALASELADVSKRFALMKGLSFEDEAKGASRTLILRGSQVELSATVESKRLRIMAFGPTKPKSSYIASDNLAAQYIRVAQSVRSDCPQCAGFALDDIRD